MMSGKKPLAVAGMALAFLLATNSPDAARAAQGQSSETKTWCADTAAIAPSTTLAREATEGQSEAAESLALKL